jgi:hypothetical protein
MCNILTAQSSLLCYHHETVHIHCMTRFKPALTSHLQQCHLQFFIHLPPKDSFLLLTEAIFVRQHATLVGTFLLLSLWFISHCMRVDNKQLHKLRLPLPTQMNTKNVINQPTNQDWVCFGDRNSQVTNSIL